MRYFSSAADVYILAYNNKKYNGMIFDWLSIFLTIG